MNNLKLRNFVAGDFDAYHRMMSDYDVVKMSLSWPWPPDREFTRKRMNSVATRSGQMLAIVEDGVFAGNIGLINNELIYLLGKPFWGRGIATWAVKRMLEYGFSDPACQRIGAGTWHDNPASMAVLKKCGFKQNGESTLFCVPRGCDVSGPDFALTRGQWENGNG